MNGFLDRLKGALKTKLLPVSVDPDSQQLLEAIIAEVVAGRDGWGDRIKLSDCPSWVPLKTADDQQQINLAIAAIVSIRSPGGSGGQDYWTRREALPLIAGQLLRRKLPFTTADLAPMLFKAAKFKPIGYYFPVSQLLTACERLCDGKPAQGDLRAGLRAVLANLNSWTRRYNLSQSRLKMRDRTIVLLDPRKSKSAQIIPPGPWGKELRKWLENLPAKQRENWTALVAHMSAAGSKSKPTKAWLADAKPLVAKIGRPKVTAQIVNWLADTTPNPEAIDSSLDLLKGFIWLCQTLAPDDIVLPVGGFATVCFRKVPQIGARSVKLGNACLLTLEALEKNDAAVAELARLVTVIKYPSVIDSITQRLTRIALARGTTIDDLQEMSLPTYDLSADGTTETILGESIATITVRANDTSLTWATLDNAPRKAPPAAVKRDHGDEIKALRVRVKTIDATRKALINTLEDSWLNDRAWPAAVWQSRFVDHPLRRAITRVLIWRVQDGDSASAAMLKDSVLTDLQGKPLKLADTAEIRLWHPLDSTPDEVLAWRRQIMAKDITQPIKQAHREIYVLTDAERTTDIYSNRFAAHILRQHQFRALCHARHWAFEYLGGWDNWNVPHRLVPRHGLSVEFSVEPVESGGTSEAYIPLHLASDQVRFLDEGGQQMRLETIAPVVFSELMRDVDLFVAVTSVANDPDWTDGGPEGQFGEYWQSYAFGDLTQTAGTRRELLLEIVPKLSFADRARVTDRFLEIDGKINSYKIHLGSSNIQIMPQNRYLCIVRGRTGKADAKVRLPFTGDTMMSIILSKAFMLAEDDKIADKTILAQLR